MKENELQLKRLFDGYIKKFKSLPQLKNTLVAIKSVQDLSRLDENQYHLFINEVIVK